MEDEFKVNMFFDEKGPTFEEIVMGAFEEKVIEILKKHQK